MRRTLLTILALICNAGAIVPLALGDALAQAADSLEREAKRISVVRNPY